VPGLVVLNPGKKKRFLKGEHGLTQAGISETLDKILGGDARFKMIKGNNLLFIFARSHARPLHLLAVRIDKPGSTRSLDLEQ
jgi:hypothetical protein